MSFEVTTNFVQQFKNTVDMLVRQQGSILMGAVTVDPMVVGKSKFTEQIGAGVAVKSIARHADTPLTPAPHRRRKYDLFDYRYVDLIDHADKVRLLIDPENPYVQAAKDAMGNAMDDEIIAAMTGDAKTGEDGTTTTVLPTSQKVAVDFVESGAPANSGLTLGKLRQARKILLVGNVDVKNEQLYCGCSPQQLIDLLRVTEVTSADFNTVRALVNGELDTYVGFKFIVGTRFAINTSTDVRKAVCWAKRGVELGLGMEPTGRLTERADKNYSVQVFYMMTIGATRLQEEKVVEISCDESP